MIVILAKNRRLIIAFVMLALTAFALEIAGKWMRFDYDREPIAADDRSWMFCARFKWQFARGGYQAELVALDHDVVLPAPAILEGFTDDSHLFSHLGQANNAREEKTGSIWRLVRTAGATACFADAQLDHRLDLGALMDINVPVLRSISLTKHAMNHSHEGTKWRPLKTTEELMRGCNYEILRGKVRIRGGGDSREGRHVSIDVLPIGAVPDLEWMSLPNRLHLVCAAKPELGGCLEPADALSAALEKDSGAITSLADSERSRVCFSVRNQRWQWTMEASDRMRSREMIKSLSPAEYWERISHK